jgi:tetratricopeptide (TPR) repeat protein
MSLSGRLKTMDLAEVLQWAAIGRKTGSLAFVLDKTKVFLYLKDGKIISSISNDPTKQLGQFLIFQGKLTEAQLKKALEIHLKTRERVGRIFIREKFVSKEDVQEALVKRTEEVIYELFLWEDGYFHFSDKSYRAQDLILIDADINAILFEGVRRKDEWGRIRSVFPNNDIVLSLRRDVDLKKHNLTPLQKKLLFLITLKKPISEIILELHGSDFMVCFELFQLYEKEIAGIAEIRETKSQEEENPADLFNKGQNLLQQNRYREAIAKFQQVIRLDPQNAWASEQLERAEKALCQEYYSKSFPAGKVPYFLVPESTLAHHNLTHEEGFVASRINGTWDTKSIIMLSPLRELEILQVLDKLMKMGLIGLR